MTSSDITVKDARKVGRKAGRAMAIAVWAKRRIFSWNLRYDGIWDKERETFRRAGIAPSTPEWRAAEKALEEAYNATIGACLEKGVS